MKVFIAVPCSEIGRYPKFWTLLNSVHRPSPLYGALQFEEFTKATEGTYLEACASPYIANNQNTLARQFMKSGADYFWLTNDDQLYMPDTLARLLSHRKDVIVPICLGHDFPCEPLIFDRLGDTPDSYLHRYLRPNDHLIGSLIATGGGGMLIHRRVMEKIGDPWWDTHMAYLPHTDPMQSTEDIDFCKKVLDAGFEIWCDTDCAVGHITIFDVWPARQQDGTWATMIKRNHDYVTIPAVREVLPEDVSVSR